MKKTLLFVPFLACAALGVKAQEAASEATEQVRNQDTPEPVPHEPLDAEVQGLPEEQAAGNSAGSQDLSQVGSPGVEGREPGNDPLAAPDERNDDAAARARSAPAPEVGVSAHEGSIAEGQPGAASALARDFASADLDGDGVLSIEEARQAFPASIEIIDSDRDGELSKLELQTGVPGLHFDEGGDALSQSRITESEWESVVQALDEAAAQDNEDV